MRIAIIGPEAAGKTELAKYLAEKLGGTATEEYARIYWQERQLPADHALSAEEMREVMRGQQSLEQGDELLFIDASTIHGPLYMAMSGEVDAEVQRIAVNGGYDAFILCQPHEALGWEDDGMRAMPNITDRYAFAEACHAFVGLHYPDKPCIVVNKASWEARATQAEEAMKELL